jgi:hypothetical protein
VENLSPDLLIELATDGPLAVLVGLTIWRLTSVEKTLNTILQNQEQLIGRILAEYRNK